jgi:hypothetical protein
VLARFQKNAITPAEAVGAGIAGFSLLGILLKKAANVDTASGSKNTHV